jgi:iron-sulfur cluster assembly accessory protein
MRGRWAIHDFSEGDPLSTPKKKKKNLDDVATCAFKTAHVRSDVSERMAGVVKLGSALKRPSKALFSLVRVFRCIGFLCAADGGFSSPLSLRLISLL